MEASPSAMLKLLVPKTPLIMKTALFHTLSWSDTSTKWDLRTELTIKILRDMLGPNGKRSPISKLQNATINDPGVKGKVWASKVKIDVPEEDNVRQMLFKAIEDMGTGTEVWTKPEARPLEAEWSGYREGVPDNAPEPAGMSEQEKYDNIVKSTSSKVTILYFHGGAMYLLDPSTYRPVTSKLAKASGGRVFSVRYRLAPQNPFPAALLDALTAYLSLLYPPPSAPHAPIPANEIVFGGDSAGGCLCAALLQLLLHIHRTTPPGQTPEVLFHGKTVPIPLPAGVAMTSPWLDVTRSLPSLETNAKYDYLPPPSHTQHMAYPSDSIWPVSPPRADLYCEGSALTHPLVSPLAARDWTNAPPLFFSVGQEMLYDEDAVLAKRVVEQGGKVVWREFEAMPHCFAMMLDTLSQADVHLEEYGAFCKAVVEKEGAGVSTNGVVIKARSGERETVDVGGLTQLGDGEVDEYMRGAKERLEKRAGAGSVEARPNL